MINVKKPTRIAADTEFLSPGWYFSIDHETIYYIESLDKDDVQLLHTREVLQSGELGTEYETFYLHDLYVAEDGAQAPILAPTLEGVLEQIGDRQPRLTSSAAVDLPEDLLERADMMLRVVKRVEDEIHRQYKGWKAEQELKQQQVPEGTKVKKERFRRTPILKSVLKELGPDTVCMVSYYEYRKRCVKGHWDRVQIASQLRRNTFGQSKLTPAQAHFVDKHVLRYCGRQALVPGISISSGGKIKVGKPIRMLPAMRPSRVYKIILSTLQRTGNQWIDPDLCVGKTREDIAGELLDTKIQMASILANPEKKNVLTTIQCPSRGWFYEYLAWFKNQPGKGKKLVENRYGKEMWEHEFLVFDTFVALAKLPLQYVVADHHLIKCFILDRQGRRHPIRLWLTVLADCYSRAIVGWHLSEFEPGIESIQSALRHAIWPKNPATDIEWEKWETPLPYVAYGIPKVLSLDNAWAHHSHSLENLARQISMGGQFTKIELVHRPPYKARWGALIESLFRNLNGQIKELLPGAIQSGSKADIQAAANQACLLYEDVYNIIYRLILNYMHTKHSQLGMTPHQKYIEGMGKRHPHVPPLDDEAERLFWRLHPETRTLGRNGFSVFGLQYTPQVRKQGRTTTSQALPKVGRQGAKVRYSFRYQSSDISRLALYNEEGEYVGDVYAKRFREPDGTTRPVNLWAWQTAKNLYETHLAETGNKPDDLALQTYVEQLTRVRQGEHRRALQDAAAAAAGGDVAGKGKGSKRDDTRVVSKGGGLAVEEMEKALSVLGSEIDYGSEEELLGGFLAG